MMNQTSHQNLKILAFVGAAHSGKSTATHYLAEKGFPKIHLEAADNEMVAEKTIDQIKHLSDAGQHRVVVDGIHNWDEYKALRHAFPGEITTVSISRRLDQNETTDQDDLATGADYSIQNDGSLEELYKQLDALIHEIEFS